MSDQPIVIERLLDAPSDRVWDALTQNAQMKNWYFNLLDFQAVVGFEFSFTAGGKGEIQYVHCCKVTEVIPGQKLAYSWRYQGYPGNTVVSFELFEAGEKTRLRLTHQGLESLAGGGPDFTRENFRTGWTQILDQSLKKFVEEGTGQTQ